MDPSMSQDALNFQAYSDRRVVNDFSHGFSLQKPEHVILTRIAPDIAGGEILDIGVGCGRTTPALLEISDRYIGIDYSQSMVDVCEGRYPGQHFMVLDARKLDIFSSNRFDLIFFSFNGLDTVGHADRLTILAKVFKVLKRGGYFVFSSHNRDFKRFERFLRKLPEVTIGRNPLRLLKACSKLPLLYYRHAKNSKNNVIESDYAIINEPAHDYQMMQYYISIPSQINQLQAFGFDDRTEAFNADGNIVEHDQDSGWIYYVARKP